MLTILRTTQSEYQKLQGIKPLPIISYHVLSWWPSCSLAVLLDLGNLYCSLSWGMRLAKFAGLGGYRCFPSILLSVWFDPWKQSFSPHACIGSSGPPLHLTSCSLDIRSPCSLSICLSSITPHINLILVLYAIYWTACLFFEGAASTSSHAIISKTSAFI